MGFFIVGIDILMIIRDYLSDGKFDHYKGDGNGANCIQHNAKLRCFSNAKLLKVGIIACDETIRYMDPKLEDVDEYCIFWDLKCKP